MKALINEHNDIVVHVPTSEDMHYVGQALASVIRPEDVVLLSGPLGAGKTTFAQGFGGGLDIHEPIVSPTFTIARELNGVLCDKPIRLVHVDAYRIGGAEAVDDHNNVNYAATMLNELLDQLESLGLDEVLESPDDSTVVLMEWGEAMVQQLTETYCSIRIERPLDVAMTKETQENNRNILTSDGERVVTIHCEGVVWQKRYEAIMSAINEGVYRK